MHDSAPIGVVKENTSKCNEYAFGIAVLGLADLCTVLTGIVPIRGHILSSKVRREINLYFLCYFQKEKSRVK